MQSLITSVRSTIIVLFAISQVVQSAPVPNPNGFDLSLFKLGNITPGLILPSNTIGTTPGGVLIPAPNPIRNPVILPASSGPGSANGNLEPASIPQQDDVAVANLNYLVGIN